MIRYDILPSRCGDLLVAIDERGLLHVDFVAGLRALPDMSGWRQDKVVLALFSRNLRPILPTACNASPCRSHQEARRFSKRSGRRCATFPTARPAATATSPAPSASPMRCGRWVPPTTATRSRSSSPATG